MRAILLLAALGCGRSAEPRPAAMMSPEAAPDRGTYLALHVALCVFCHSPIDWKAEGAPPLAGSVGAGRAPFSESTPWLSAPNLTPDRDTGAGGWSDEQFDRALRRGIGADGRTLHPAMPYAAYHSMTGEDAAAVVAYFRSLRPVRRELPPSRIPDEIRAGLHPLPPPEGATPAKRGAYLTSIALCGRCHTPVDDRGAPIPGMEFAGGLRLKGPWGDLHSPNLTPHYSGLECMEEQAFLRAMRTGELPGHTLNAIMPWGYYRGMTDDDLRAIFAHLRALKPVRHFIDNSIAPTPCRACGHPHGLGDKNGD